VQAFSLRKNVSVLFSLSRSPDDIESVHGVRAISALLVLAGHKSMALSFNPYLDRTTMAEVNFFFYGRINWPCKCITALDENQRFWFRVNIVSLMFCQQLCWGFLCYEMRWLCFRRTARSLLKDIMCSTSGSGRLTPCTAWPWRWKHYDLSEHQ